MKRKAQAELRRDYGDWTTHPDRCAICWIPTRRLAERFGNSLELAHVISRGQSGPRADVLGNVLFLCSSCHGSQHNTGYHFNGIRWPEIKQAHLFRAKLELGELSVHELAAISGYTPRYILDLTMIKWPEPIQFERWKWGD